MCSQHSSILHSSKALLLPSLTCDVTGSIHRPVSSLGPRCGVDGPFSTPLLHISVPFSSSSPLLSYTSLCPSHPVFHSSPTHLCVLLIQFSLLSYTSLCPSPRHHWCHSPSSSLHYLAPASSRPRHRFTMHASSTILNNRLSSSEDLNK